MDASNPFGDQIIAPRDLDAEALYERWFQEADNGERRKRVLEDETRRGDGARSVASQPPPPTLFSFS